MKAVGYKTPLPIADAQSLLDIEIPAPVATSNGTAKPVETSEADSSGGGVDDGEGDLRCLLEGAGLVSLV